MLIMSNGFTDSELRTIKVALKYWLRNNPTMKFFNTKPDEELLRKVRMMLGESMQIAEEDGKEMAQRILDRVFYQSHEIEV